MSDYCLKIKPAANCNSIQPLKVRLWRRAGCLASRILWPCPSSKCL